MKKIYVSKEKLLKTAKTAGKGLCAVLALALIVTGVLGIYDRYKRGDSSMLPDTGTKKAYSTEFSTVKLNPGSNRAGRLWRDGMVGGNGVQGFVNAGSPYSDTIIYQNVNFIMPSDRDRDYLDDLTADLEEARQAIINFDDSWVCSDADWNYNYTFHPGHQLRLSMKSGLYTDYIRWTDYETGEVGLKYTDKNGTWERRTFTSREDGVTVTSIGKSSKDGKINMTLSIDDCSALWKYWGDEVNMQYKKLVDPDCTYIALAAHYPSYETSELMGAGYAGVTYVVTVGGSKELVQQKDTDETINVGGIQNPAIQITGADAVYLITKSDIDYDMGSFDEFKDADTYKLVDALADECAGVADKYGGDDFDYDKALAPSAAEHGALFNKISFSLGDKSSFEQLSNEQLIKKQRWHRKLSDELVEQAYNQGRYAMICCAGTTMSRLSGMWTGEWNPGWRSAYTMDANVNLQSSGMNTANIMDFGVGYINFVLRQIKDWETNAEKLYGMTHAIMAPVNTDGTRALSAEYCKEYPFQYWNAGASWMLQPIYEFWQCYGNMAITTDDGDKDLLADILLPLLTMQSNFWDQLCTAEYFTDKDGNARYQKGKTALEDGERYLIIPSYSPENYPGGNYQSTITANATIDISAACDGLRMTIETEKQTKTDGWEDRVSKWEHLLSKLPEYTFDDTGAICEWAMKEYEENNTHRHISHLYCAWPAYETQGNEQLIEACEQAIANRKKENTAAHGWVHKGLVFARLKNGEDVYSTLHTIMDSRIYYTSLMTDHNTNRGSNTYCTDTSFGTIGIIDETLLYSNTGEIEILPALPSRWTEGSISGLMARTQAEVSITWKDGKASVTVLSNTEQTIKISCAGKNAQSVKFAAGEEKTLQFDF